MLSLTPGTDGTSSAKVGRTVIPFRKRDADTHVAHDGATLPSLNELLAAAIPSCPTVEHDLAIESLEVSADATLRILSWRFRARPDPSRRALLAALPRGTAPRIATFVPPLRTALDGVTTDAFHWHVLPAADTAWIGTPASFLDVQDGHVAIGVHAPDGVSVRFATSRTTSLDDLLRRLDLPPSGIPAGIRLAPTEITVGPDGVRVAVEMTGDPALAPPYWMAGELLVQASGGAITYLRAGVDGRTEVVTRDANGNVIRRERIAGKPLTIAALARDAGAASLLDVLPRAVRDAELHHLLIEADPGMGEVLVEGGGRFGGVAAKVGVLHDWRKKSVRFDLRCESEAVPFHQILETLVVGLPKEALPYLPFGKLGVRLTSLSLDSERKRAYVSGGVAIGSGESAVGVAVQLEDGCAFSLQYESTEREPITLAAALDGLLPAGTLEQILALTGGSELVRKLLADFAVHHVDFEVDVGDGGRAVLVMLEAKFRLAPLAHPLTLRLDVARSASQPTPAVRLAFGSDEAEGIGLAQLATALGIPLGASASHLPSMKLGLQELCVDTAQRSFRIAAVVSNGFEAGAQAPKAYSALAALDLKLVNGALAVRALIDAEEKPVTLAALAKDLRLDALAGLGVDVELRSARLDYVPGTRLEVSCSASLTVEKLLREIAGVDVLPEGVPTGLTLDHFSLVLGTGGAVEISAAIELDASSGESLTLGGRTLKLARLDLSLTKSGTEAFACAMEVSGRPDIELAEGVRCESYALGFEYDRTGTTKAWQVGGHLQAVIDDSRRIRLAAKYESDGTKQVLTLEGTCAAVGQTLSETAFAGIGPIDEATSKEIVASLKRAGLVGADARVTEAVAKPGFELKLDPPLDRHVAAVRAVLEPRPLVEIPGHASITPRRILLRVERGRSTATFELEAAGDLTVLDPLASGRTLLRIEDGTLKAVRIEDGTLKAGSGSAKLSFTAEKARTWPLAWIPGVDAEVAKAVAFGLKEAAFEKDATGWTCAVRCGATIDDTVRQHLVKAVPADVQPIWEAVLPRPATVGAPVELGMSLGIDGKGLLLRFTNTAGLVVPSHAAKLCAEIERALRELPRGNEDEERLKKSVAERVAELRSLLDIGDSFVLLERFQLALGKTFSVKLGMAFGLPSKLNERLFDSEGPFRKLLRTFDPGRSAAPGERDDLQRFEIEIDRRLDVKGSFTKLDVLDLSGLDPKLREAITTPAGKIAIDFDALFPPKGGEPRRYGTIEFVVPKFAGSLSGEVKVSGGYALRPPDPKKPLVLVPVRPFVAFLLNAILGQASAREIAESGFVPEGIPLGDIDFFPEVNGTRRLSLDDLEGWLRKLLGTPLGPQFSLPVPLKQAVRGLGDVADRLPERFKSYLNIHLPLSFDFALSITADKGVTLATGVEQTDPKKRDSIQFLLPSPSGFLYGVRLERLGIGAALAGNALRIDWSGEIDTFDLVTLGASLLLPDKHSEENRRNETLQLMLPDRSRFCRTLAARDLVVFVLRVQVGPVPVPVPVPVFATMLRMAHFGLEGIESEAQLGFQFPSIAGALKAIGPALKFLTTEEFARVTPYPYDRPAEPKEDELALKVGPLYVQLPGYLGHELVGPKKQPVVLGWKDTLHAYPVDLVTMAANATKALALKKRVEIADDDPAKRVSSPPVDYLVKYLPLKDRVAIRRFSLFHVFDMDVAWAFSTPDEFAEVVYPRMLEAYAKEAAKPGRSLPVPRRASPAGALLDLLARQDEGVGLPPGRDQGVVVFLRGGIDVAKAIAFEGAVGLSISERGGFRTGIGVRGQVFDWLESESFFFLKINPNAKEVFAVLGDTHLKVFNREVLKGAIGIRNARLELTGMLDAFPPGFPVQLRGFARGMMAPDVFELQAAAGLQLGTFRAGCAIDVAITKDRQRCDVDLRFATAAARLEVERTAGPDASLLRAGMVVDAFRLLRLEGRMQARREPHRMALAGTTSLTTPAIDVVRLGLSFEGEIDATRGVLALGARLSEDSSILTPHCRVRGGAAFAAWFAGRTAGDFALTVGGYHPAFALPAHYPRVPRVGIEWRIDPHSRITGDAYLAITPGAIMAGARLELVFQRGNVRVWFAAHVDFLCQWKPLYFEASVGIHVGASYTLQVAWWSVTTEVSVGATLFLCGPPLAGRVEIRLPLDITIPIAFGDARPAAPRLTTWAQFEAAFLPERASLLRITPDRGVTRIEGGTWIVRGDELAFSVTTAVPARTEGSAPLHVRPLDGAPLDSTIAVTIGAVPLETRASTSSVPAALWGARWSHGGALDPAASLVGGVVTALSASPAGLREGARVVVPIERLRGRAIVRQALPTLRKPTPTPPTGGWSLATLQPLLDASADRRRAVARAAASVDPGYPAGYGFADDTLDGLTRAIASHWRDCPRVAGGSR